jgi:hypothetical protein
VLNLPDAVRILKCVGDVGEFVICLLDLVPLVDGVLVNTAFVHAIVSQFST